MKYVWRENPQMFVQFAVKVMGVDGSYRQTEDIVMEGIEKLSAFFRSIGQPTTLGELGIGEDRLEEMARKATHECFGQEHPIGGLKKLYWQDVLAIYQLAR